MSQLLEVARALLKQKRIHEVIPVQAYSKQDGLFLLNEQSTNKSYLGFVLEMNPLAAVGDDYADKVNGLLARQMPAGSFVQMALWSSPDVSGYLDRMIRMRFSSRKHPNEELNKLLDGFVAETAEMISDCVKEPIESINLTKVRDFRLIISVKIPCKSKIGADANDLSLAKEIMAGFTQTLDTMGLFPEKVDAERYLRLMGTMINWGDQASWKNEEPIYDKNREISKQVADLDTCIDIETNTLLLGDKKRVRILSPRRLPEYFSISQMSGIAGHITNPAKAIRSPFICSLNIFYPEISERRAKLDKDRGYVNIQSVGALARFMPKIALKQQSFESLFSALEGGDMPVQMSFNFSVFGDSDEDLAEATNSMISYYRELGLQLLTDEFVVLPMFVGSLPLCADPEVVNHCERYYDVATRHAAQFAPVAATWKGGPNPAIQLFSRNGNPIGYDLWVTDSNMNAVVAAASGSGKSFYTNSVILNYLSLGAQVWTIDVGRSYLNLCKTVGGDFIVFDNKSNLCLNPFQLVANYEEESDMLVSLVGTMASPTEKLTDLQTASLREVMKQQWDLQGSGLVVDDIAAALKSSNDDRVRDLGKQLFAFTSQGEYGRYFNGENNVSFKNPFTVLELEELKGRKHLQKVVLLQQMMQIGHAMYLGDREVKKLVICDESWELLAEGGEIASFLMAGYRKFRKYNGAAMVILQSLFDLYQSDNGRAIAENSAHMFLLMQKAETIDNLEKTGRLQIGDYGYELMRSVRTYKGHFSEMLIKGPQGLGVGRLCVTDYFKILNSTDPKDTNAINRLMAGGLTLDEAIKTIVKQRKLEGQ
jgi:conjugal transfer ATP-binding protein TraC